MALKKKELGEVKTKLEQLKSDTVNSITAIKNEAKSLEEAAADMDSFDLSSNNSEMNRLKNLQTQKNTYLDSIKAALVRVDSGKFGECSDCGDDIPHQRLIKNPMAIRCISCQEDKEHIQKQGRGRSGINNLDSNSSSSSSDEE